MRYTHVLACVLGAAVLIGMPTTISASPIAATGEPCTTCPPSSSWIPNCFSGVDAIENTAVLLTLDFDLDCEPDETVALSACGPLIIERGDPEGPVIETEILEMCYSNDDYWLRAGLGQGGILSSSPGAIIEDTSDASFGHSYFEVFLELETPVGVLYNHDPLAIRDLIKCFPPRASYSDYNSCLALYDNPDPGQGTHVANLVAIRLDVNQPRVPALTGWGVVILLALIAGSALWFLTRRKRVRAGIR